MKKIIKYFILLICLLPLNAFALTNDYQDDIASIVNKPIEDDKVNIYLFEGEGCPHCKQEKEWLETIKEKYPDQINVYEFEVWYNPSNSNLLSQVQTKLSSSAVGVPYTVIGNSFYSGFSDTVQSDMESKLDGIFTDDTNDNIKDIPVLGKVDVSKISLPLISIILGFIDGFNPCAMWVLLFLITIILNMEDKKKRWFIGFAFLFTSGLVYFLSMLGINVVLSMIAVSIIRTIIAIFILVMGILSLTKYFKNRKKEVGCTIVKGNRRKKIIEQVNKVSSSKNFLIALVGVIGLAIGVNLVELACSLGFPVVYSEILAINNVTGVWRIIYLLLYILFYMIDDIVVFVISMVTLETTGITNKYNKICNLISAIIMILLGLLLIFKPAWVMLNF
jgi:thiol-disulfide isomerase/thioredoxin